MGLEVIHIRASIKFIESGLSVDTPYIKSFNVTRNRGAMSTFTASLKVDTEVIGQIRGQVTIYSGPEGSLNKIFTGYVKTAAPSPCWDDPNYFIVNVSGVDALYKLNNRRFTRRQVYSDTMWALLTQVNSRGKRTGRLKYTNKEPQVITTSIDNYSQNEGVTSGNAPKAPETTNSSGATKVDTLKPAITVVPSTVTNND